MAEAGCEEVTNAFAKYMVYATHSDGGGSNDTDALIPMNMMNKAISSIGDKAKEEGGSESVVDAGAINLLVWLLEAPDDGVVNTSKETLAHITGEKPSREFMAKIIAKLKDEKTDLSEEAYLQAIVLLHSQCDITRKHDLLEILCGLLSERHSHSLPHVLEQVELLFKGVKDDKKQLAEACSVAKGCGGLANLSHLQHHQERDICVKAVYLIDTFFKGERHYEVPEADFISRTFKHAALPTNSFGDMVIPGYGTRKYLRVDMGTSARPVMELLTEQWNMEKPALVLSLSGIVKHDYLTKEMKFTVPEGMPKTFKEGIRRTACMARTWALTSENTMPWAASLMGEVAKDLTPAELSIISFHQWDTLPDKELLAGCNVGSKATYGYSIDDSSNDLDPNHTAYFFIDKEEGKHIGLKHILEGFIHNSDQDKKQNDDSAREKGYHVPVVHLVVGGDITSLPRILEAQEQKMGIIIVNGSGGIADSLAEIYKGIVTFKRSLQQRTFSEGKMSRNKDTMNEAYNQEVLKIMEKRNMTTLLSESKLIQNIMDRSNLEKIGVYGEKDKDTKDLAEAIFTVIFRGTDKSQMLFYALAERNTALVSILLNKRYGGGIRLKSSLSLAQLSDLHKENLNAEQISSKVLKEKWLIEEYDNNMPDEAKKIRTLSHVGRILNKLLGDKYKMLYQKMTFDQKRESAEDEATWHVFLYAVLSNQPDVAELLLARIELHSKLAAALVAFHLLSQIASAALELKENECAKQLNATADHFQMLAVKALNILYESNGTHAYACLVSQTTFNWGSHVTPLAIASAAQASSMMDHASCRTLMKRFWLQSMSTSTENWQIFPLFLIFPVNVLSIHFDCNNLNFYQENKDTDPPEKKTESKPINCWYKIKNYYTCPMNIFLMHTMMWFIFLAMFAHTLITDLRPSLQQTSVYQYLVVLWVACLTLGELEQVTTAFMFNSFALSGYAFGFFKITLVLLHFVCLMQLLLGSVSSPVANMKGDDWNEPWQYTFPLLERMYFRLKLYKISQWSKSGWNLIDAVMLLSFWVAVICHCTLPSVHFGIVRIVYSISFIIFGFRTLRIGYIFESIGPRILTIYHLMRDLAQFLMILAVSVVGFGVAYQAILIPNQPISWYTLASVMWRPYWQMYGELFLEDGQEGMGRPLPEDNPPVCTYNMTLALMHPEVTPYCYSWMAPLLEALYAVITNILLLNLLIAIFSTSFTKIEENAREIWAVHYYSFVHEYYHMPWLPAPLSLICYLYRLARWLFSLRSRCCCKGEKDESESAERTSGSYCILCEPQPCPRQLAQAEHFAFEAAMKENSYEKQTDTSNADRLDHIEDIIKQIWTRLDLGQKSQNAGITKLEKLLAIPQQY